MAEGLLEERGVLTLSGANRLREELKRLRAAVRPSNPGSPDAAQRIALLETVLARSEIVDAASSAEIGSPSGPRCCCRSMAER